MLRAALLASLLCLLAAPRAALAAEALTITRAQYQLFKDYQDALQDERVQKLKEKDRLPAIARNFKIKEKDLREALEAGEQQGPQVESSENAALASAYQGTALQGRTGELRVDASKGHVVTYVQWFNADPALLDQEACLAAVRAVGAAPLTGTVFLYAHNAGKKDQKVYSSLISAENASRIKEDQIHDFAQTRYLRLFEKRQAGSAP
jgi:hypothetical protein